MIYIIVVALIGGLAYGPHLWVRHVLKKHSKDINEAPGTGGELANHLVDRFELEGVVVEIGIEGQDHYSPDKKLISLSPSVYKGKSITAISVATHEVGHAIQFIKKEPVSLLRKKYLGKALLIKKIGAAIMFVIPIVAIVFRVPHIIFISAVIGIVTMLASALMYVAILPEEYDASFNKALPILKEGYVPDEYIADVEQVLKAAALTYFSGALSDILRLWTWLRVFSR